MDSMKWKSQFKEATHYIFPQKGTENNNMEEREGQENVSPNVVDDDEWATTPPSSSPPSPSLTVSPVALQSWNQNPRQYPSEEEWIYDWEEELVNLYCMCKSYCSSHCPEVMALCTQDDFSSWCYIRSSGCPPGRMRASSTPPHTTFGEEEAWYDECGELVLELFYIVLEAASSQGWSILDRCSFPHFLSFCHFHSIAGDQTIISSPPSSV